MSKKKLNTNGTLLNLLLLGGAAVILKKRTGSLRGIGSVENKKNGYTVDCAIVMDNGEYIDLSSRIFSTKEDAIRYFDRMDDFYTQLYPYVERSFGKKYKVFYKNPNNKTEDCIAFDINPIMKI